MRDPGREQRFFSSLTGPAPCGDASMAEFSVVAEASPPLIEGSSEDQAGPIIVRALRRRV